MSISNPEIIVIGGGIVGTFAARDAAGRGFRTLLCEEKDLASGTTSRSSRLAHGGLRYLEHLEFGLVYDSLKERERLFRNAPDFAHPERFHIPISGGGRHPTAIRAGLWFYDLLAGTKAARTEPDGFSYLDGFCEPERMAVQAACEARDLGAEIRTYCPVQKVTRDGVVRLETGEEFRPRAIIGALGPWADQALARWGIAPSRPLLRRTRGTHLLLEYPIDRPMLLESRSDGRVFFVLPMWGGTLVGTTDIDDQSDPREARPRSEEIDYLLAESGRRLPELRGAKLKGAWTGQRPLLNGGGASSDRSRDERFYRSPAVPTMYLCLGGKLTTARLMAERVLNRIERRIFERPPSPWTAAAPLIEREKSAFVVKLSDQLLRRSLVGYSLKGAELRRSAEEFANRVGWSNHKFEDEWKDFACEATRDLHLDIL